jgi:hypothetical protein
MEVAQDGGQAAHVVGVGVGEGYRVEMADAARPESLRHDFFADVEILRGLVRAAAEAAAIDEQRFAVGRDEEQESPWPTSMASMSRALWGCLMGAERRRRGRQEATRPRLHAGPSGTASQHHGCGEQCAERCGLDEQRSGDAEIAQRERAEEVHEPGSEMKRQRHEYCWDHSRGGPDKWQR